MKRIGWLMAAACFVFLFVGSPAWAQVELAGDLKELVPVYPGAKVTSSLVMGEAQNGVIETGDPTADVASFYESAMKEKGWKMEMKMDQEEAHMLAFSKDEYKLVVSVHSEDGKAQAALVLSKE